MTSPTTLFTPPKPAALPPVAALIRTIWRGDGDLLSLLPGAAYRMQVGELGYSRRSIKLFNDPALVREILTDPEEIFPKSDLMVGALEPLIGDSIFVSDGEKWRRQRAMIDPAFSMMRLSVAYQSMTAAVDAFTDRYAAAADDGAAVSLDLAMSHLTADIICRAVFSVSLASDVAREVFDDFLIFERDVAQVKIWRLIVDPAWTEIRQTEGVLSACRRIRSRLGDLIDTHTAHLAKGEPSPWNDIASAVIDARDAATGERFTREELIDQLGVFFLAGHETTASALTWAFYILATRPEILNRIRAETDAVVGSGPIEFGHVKRMPFTRSVFRETLRLYPPITFMPRVALRSATIGRHRVRRGALIMISPWTVHRHRDYWPNCHEFDPDRFTPDREKSVAPGAYIPFGYGPHTCVGAGFAGIESVLIMAHLTRAFDFEIREPEKVRPAARLTTRPARQIYCRLRRRA